MTKFKTLLPLVAVLLATVPLRAEAPARASLATVRASTPEQVRALLSGGFDLAETRNGDRYDVVLWGDDLGRLKDRGLDVVGVRPLVSLPVRTGYRRLSNYESEMRALALAHPAHVRLFEAPHRSAEGRTVYGLEIAANVAVQDGRPTSFIMGLHHAREWPAAEASMDFAVHLATKYGTDSRVTALLNTVRVLVVPIVNVDGFTYSRDFPYEDGGSFGVIGQGAYWRKNRRGVVNTTTASAGVFGVDPNRNYGYQWGGGVTDFYNSTSAIPTDQTYQGPTPFSEPETQNVRAIVTANNVTTLVTNHTYGRLVLYPWGHTTTAAPDAVLLRELAVAMAQQNGYTAQRGIDLYATTGSTEDWSYAATGGFGFTIEMGNEFHPPFSQMPGISSANRKALLVAAEAAATPRYHSIVTGTVKGPNGEQVAADLRLTRTGTVAIHSRWQPVFGSTIDTVDFRMQSAANGSFGWHVPPSTRPIADEDEAYTLTISAPGYGTVTQDVIVARGATAALGTVVLPAA